MALWGEPGRPLYTGVDVLHAGDVTAASLVQGENLTGPRIAARLRVDPGAYGCVVLSFGTVDCRTEILTAAILQDVSVEQAVARAVERYMAFVLALRAEFEVPVLLWGPAASPPQGSDAAGSEVERNYTAWLFAQALRRAAATRRRVAQFDILETALTPGWETRPGFLAEHGAGLGAAEAALRVCLRGLGLSRLVPALTRTPPISARRTLRNIVEGLPYTTSSIAPDTPVVPFSSPPIEGYKFHTPFEEGAWLLFDFGASYVLHEIIVHNRSVHCMERASRLAAAVSQDGLTFETIFAPDAPLAFGGVHEGTPLHIGVTHTAPVRYLKLFLREAQALHLDHVQVLAYTFTP